MQLIFQTRFSYLGLSGWKSEESRDHKQLFSKERMETRFHFFENMTLPSLKAQTDDDFHYHILSSKLMPKVFQDRLVDVVVSALGQERVRIGFEAPAKAGNYFRKYVWPITNKDPMSAQSVLDDDDALAIDFAQKCKQVSLSSINRFDTAQKYIILSYPRGFQYYHNASGDKKFAPHHERWINLGLTWVSSSPAPRKNVLLTKHKVVNRHHPVATFYGQTPMYIRTVHSHNDSRKPNANVGSRGQMIKLGENDLSRFPFMKNLVA